MQKSLASPLIVLCLTGLLPAGHLKKTMNDPAPRGGVSEL